MPARDTATVHDLTLLVRTPHDLRGYRVFTQQQRQEAERYAQAQGVTVEELP
ncbi:hypothetical protein [Mycolicibacterium bacteremicum]|uniref:hypothetical protein n=1 Tax=Mycolicibacterium bacteremicum TaxID=564198 RepID=UPI0013FD9E7C|nr:hypothetical protein [Mycolicibacterium bacteremicum]MCV7434786.1 hypothetical protein [Mycolicibacterium bacteremicum]